MKCECGCGEEADSVLETQVSGVSMLCTDCAESVFFTICQGAAEYVGQG